MVVFFSHPECLPFDVSFMISTSDQTFARSGTKVELKVCFNGDFANNAAHRIVHHAYHTDLHNLMEYISDLKLV